MSGLYANIADAAAALTLLTEQLQAHAASTKAEDSRLRSEIADARLAIGAGTAGFDLALIALAETVLEVRGQYTRAGEDRASVIRDALAQVATGKKQGYRDLWSCAFGTKNYAHWCGQRADHEYGYGPKHGSVVFSVGLRSDIRARLPQELTEAERIACVYFLTKLEEIQAVRAAVEVAA